MKKIHFLSCMFVLSLGIQLAQAQTDEATQLLLNVTKLNQLKEILSDLEQGYTTLQTGFSQIEKLSSGNFNLHETFLNQLLEVNPAVKDYYKVAEIIKYQLQLLNDYKRAYSVFRQSGQFTHQEISYLYQVYQNLMQKSLQHLDELTLVLTAGTLRMSDKERLKAIDRIHRGVKDKIQFLTSFNQDTQILALQRAKAMQELSGIRTLYNSHH